MDNLIKLNLSDLKINIDNIVLEFNTSGTGYSNSSGTSGISIFGTSATSGSSGSGTGGTSGKSGTSATSGTSGTGTSGTSSTSATSGKSGTSATSGTSGTGSSGTSGISASGTSGSSGMGVSGTSGTSATSGLSVIGTSGTSGMGVSGTSGTSSTSGKSGTSGTSGIGTSGTSGIGTSGTSGIGTSGTSGIGTSGTSATSGLSVIGTSGTSGSGSNNIIDQIDFNLNISGKSSLWGIYSTTVLSNYAFYPYDILSISVRTNIGTSTIDVRINENPISGMTNITTTDKNNIYDSTLNYSVLVGDCVNIKFNGETGGVSELYGSIKIIRPVHYIGEEFGGGIIFYIWSGGTHGLISMKTDGPKLEWGCVGSLIGTTKSDIGSGKQNTINICKSCTDINIVAKYCNDLIFDNYNDWFLPSRDELVLLYNRRNIIGNFFDDLAYWSSSEFSNNDGFSQYFISGYGYSNQWKNWQQRVRAIREF